jgi:hypothetical protein
MKKQQQQEEEEGGEGEGVAILRNPVDNNQDRHFSPFVVEPSPHPALQRLDHVAGLVLLSVSGCFSSQLLGFGGYRRVRQDWECSR